MKVYAHTVTFGAFGALARHGAVIAALVAAIFSILAPCEARADAKSCAMSHASGQREVKGGRLRLASELFTACGSDDSCPQQIRQECTEMLEQVRHALPTVLFAVRGEDGEDVSNVSVFSNDELVTKHLDGRAVEMDPGKHRLRFLMPWGEVIGLDVLVREGEKSRLVEVKLKKDEPSPAAQAAPQKQAASHAPAPREERGAPAAAWLASGAAVVGLGVFGSFAILGQSQKRKLESCAPACGEAERSSYDSMRRSFLIADIGLGVGAASAVVATVLFTAGHERATEQAKARAPLRRTKLTAALAPSGGALLVSGGF